MKWKIPAVFFSLLIFGTMRAQMPGAGNCLSFNGMTDYVDCGLVNFGTSDFSSECWVNFSLPSPGTQGIMGNWVLGTPWPSYFYVVYGLLGSTTLTAAFHRDGPAFNTYASWNTGGTLTGWHHIATVYDRDGMMELYVDGILRASASIAFADGLTINSPAPFMIGSLGSGVASFFGKIDEVRLWTKALTQAEIRDGMCRKLTGNENGLTGYWRFDSVSGTTAADSSPAGRTGTLN
ncbi:MAG: hypothetical protein FD123_2940 [Bacteroidetes bacterium]|nr:MAG: hypothetical protein FD123_2940 [Bacteroidota bacterium]